MNWCFSKYATYSERTLEQSITCAIVTNKFGHFKRLMKFIQIITTFVIFILIFKYIAFEKYLHY